MMTVALIGFGLYSYRLGYTYEGSLAFYLLPVCVLGLPYILADYRPVFVPLATLSLLPVLILIQNHGVRAGNWSYPSDKRFILGYVSEQGDGPLGWTRLLWTGVEMPAIEYLFYPLMGCFMLATFALLKQLVDRRAFIRTRQSGQVFVLSYAALCVPFLWLRLAHDKPVMDHNWYLIALGLVTGWLAYALSASFRALVETRFWWHWLLLMGCGIQPLWEFGHSCINHDWIYDPARTMPTLYEFNGAPISVVEIFGYVAVGVTFPGIQCLMSDYLPKTVKRSGRRGLGLGELDDQVLVGSCRRSSLSA